MYTKRLLEKEIKKLLKNKIIKYGEIVRLHRKYGVQSTGTL
jgi:flagellar motor switch/type III secretory pathway protein FliN|tara:strand:- start:864 stop:986 length:123 start_codon:yes stop_codon:yes gene_type:complete